MKRLVLSLFAAAALLVAAGAASAAGPHGPGPYGQPAGDAYTISNAAAGNELVVYSRADDGTLTPAGSIPAGGLGTGAGLASQGAVTLTDDGHTVLAVNPGSNSVAAFHVRHHWPTLLNTAPSGGIRPVSVAVDKKLVYVLNKNNAALATVSGFRLDKDGLTAIPGSTRLLNAGATDAAQVKFTPNGDTLVVTGRSSNKIDTFAVGEDGLLASLKTFDVAPGGTPFGFDFDNKGHLLVSLAGVAVRAAPPPTPSARTAACRRSPRPSQPGRTPPAGWSPRRTGALPSSQTPRAPPSRRSPSITTGRSPSRA